MRIVWKDSNLKSQQHRYRNRAITRYKGGWIIDISGDRNIYTSVDCACNAIDIALGGKTRKDASSRHKKGVKIIGKI